MAGKQPVIKAKTSRRIFKNLAQPHVLFTAGMAVVIIVPLAGLALAQVAPVTAARAPQTAQQTPPQPVPAQQANGRPRIDWQAAAARHQRGIIAKTTAAVVARLPKPELDKTRLPILLPRNGGALKTAQAKLISFGDAYSMNLPQGNGVQITLSGNAAAVAAPSGAISRSRRGLKVEGMAEPVQIDRTEDGWTATFTRFNVAYTADLTCDDSEAPACRTDAYLRTVVADLNDVVLGEAAITAARAAGANLGAAQ